ncbi:MAG: cytochrome P450 [Alphaproteobacteria bacterium HGW-Alphaproteobacteria-18]|nr:MAG: cytochrome P450 [Alphaproteobacteria bacterium HGW-Alphaproteobacteria-18]
MHAPVPGHVPADRVFAFNIYGDPRLTEDVQASYQSLHRDAPEIFYSPLNGGHWMITRYEHIFDIVKDYEHFSVREMQIPRIENPPVFIPLSLDPPTNLPYRQALMPHFSPKAVSAMEPKLRAFAADFIDEVLARGECDFVHDIAARFPVSVFMELMGMPLDRLRDFRALADDYFKARTNEEIGALGERIIGLMTELVELRQKEPADDLISKMIEFQVDGRPIALGELQSMLFVMFLGGMDTVTNVASYTYRHLAQDDALQARLAADASLIPRFVEEGIRSFGVINTPRLVVKDCERFGVQFREGDMVLCVLPLGSRDDRRFENSAEFDIDRQALTHLTFSSGPHLCLGHNLARMEIRILTEEWIKRIPRFSLKPGLRHHSRVGTVIAIESLPIQWPV